MSRRIDTKGRTDMSWSRRRFLETAAVAPVAGAAGAWLQGRRVPVGLELYSVRTELAKDLPGTISAVAKLGYQVVEFYAPYFNWTVDQAKDVRARLDGLGITCRSTHNNGPSFTPDGLKKAVELNQIIGSRTIVMASPPAPITTLDGWKALAERLTAVSDELRPIGMATGYHNHQTEWAPVDGTRPMDVIAAGTPKDVVLQFDVGTSVEAGQDPMAWVRANPGRIRSMHLKDWGAGAGRGYSVAFGEGDVQWKPLLDAAESIGGVEYVLIEQEVAGPAGELSMVQTCLENYRKLTSAARASAASMFGHTLSGPTSSGKPA